MKKHSAQKPVNLLDADDNLTEQKLYDDIEDAEDEKVNERDELTSEESLGGPDEEDAYFSDETRDDDGSPMTDDIPARKSDEELQKELFDETEYGDNDDEKEY